MADTPLRRACKAHTNLNTFATVVTILEGGHVYGGSPRTDKAAQEIIRICQREQQRLLREFDAARSEIGASA